MPHTNISKQPQLVTTKQDPGNPVTVQPGETIDGQALRVQAAPETPSKKAKPREPTAPKADSES